MFYYSKSYVFAPGRAPPGGIQIDPPHPWAPQGPQGGSQGPLQIIFLAIPILDPLLRGRVFFSKKKIKKIIFFTFRNSKKQCFTTVPEEFRVVCRRLDIPISTRPKMRSELLIVVKPTKTLFQKTPLFETSGRLDDSWSRAGGTMRGGGESKLSLRIL